MREPETPRVPADGNAPRKSVRRPAGTTAGVSSTALRSPPHVACRRSRLVVALAGTGLVLHAQAPAQPPDPQRRFLGGRRLPLRGRRRAAEGARRLRHLRHAQRRARQRGAADHVVRRRLPRLRLRRRPRQGLRSRPPLHRDHRDVRQRLVVVAEQHAGPARRPGLPGHRHPRQRRGVASRARTPGRHPRARRRRVFDGRRAVVPVGGLAPRLHGRDRPVVRHGEDLSSRRRQARKRDPRADHRSGVRRRTLHRAADAEGSRRGRRTGPPGCGRRNGGGGSCTNPRGRRWTTSSPRASPATRSATPTT